MAVLDVFKTSAFDMASLTTAMDKLPIVPGRVGQMGLFKTKGITTLTAQIEERHGRLYILGTAARGTRKQTDQTPDRKVRSFAIPHIPMDDVVMADEVEGVRAFGQETMMETIAGKVNDKMTAMKQNHEITWEYHRIGAIKGVVLDADASTVHNFFTDFTITEKVVDFDFSVAGKPKIKALEVIRHIRDSLGATPHSGVHALCGNTFFDELVDHTDVKAAYERWQDGEFLRTQQYANPFKFAGITWENYDHNIGATEFIPLTDARFFPVGAPDIFERINAPANYVETVNTVGKDIYVKQERQRFDTGIDLTSQSNPLFICTRPGVLVKGTNT